MKRVLLLFCTVMLIFGLLCGCGRAPADPVAPTPDPNGSQTSEPDDSTVSGEVLERLWKEVGFHGKGAGILRHCAALQGRYHHHLFFRPQ